MILTSLSGVGDPDYFLSILKEPAAASNIPASIRNHPADLMATMRLSMRRVKEYNDDEASIEADFMCMLDREKSKVRLNITCSIGHWHCIVTLGLTTKRRYSSTVGIRATCPPTL